MSKKGESQYQASIREYERRGPERLGLMTSWSWNEDPKRLAFTLARYKFVAKMLEGRARALEIGCADAFASRLVAQAVGSLVAVDFDAAFVDSARATMAPEWKFEVLCHDIMEAPVAGAFDAVFALDVLEHIPESEEARFLGNAIAGLPPDGVAIFGVPSFESQEHASQQSREGHVNCKTQADLRESLLRFFANVFIFSMNDEVVHTGYAAMSHYNLALCCGKR
jgi:2-polyprenyl-3-methyl-5-hydroxy-6-metoxy-1,4-benzoquinol methylase